MGRKKKYNTEEERKAAKKEYDAEYYASHKKERAEYNAEYRKNNRNKVRAQKAEWYKKNRDGILAQKAEWYQSHKTEMAEYYAKRYQENRDKILARQNEYYQSHKTERAEYRDAYYHQNRDKILAQRAEFYQRNRNEILAQKAEYNSTPIGRAKNLLNTYKTADKNQNRGDCTLTPEWVIQNIFSKQCHYCGETDWLKLGCDRIDNNLPHTPENCVPCCVECNKKRGTTPYDIYMKLIGKIN